MAESLRLARLMRGDQSQTQVAVGASRFLLNRTISRDYVRRLEGKSPAIAEEHADPMVIRAIAGHLRFPIAQISPVAARKLQRQGIPEISEQMAQNWKGLRGARWGQKVA